MRAAIISTLIFSGLLGTDKGPWFAALVSIYLGHFLKRLLFSDDCWKVRNAKDAAEGVLQTAVIAGFAVWYAPMLPGPEWVANTAACAAIFVCAVLVSGYFRMADEVDRAASEARK